MNPPIPGTTLRLQKTVLATDSARAFGSGLVDVFATPAMIALMEQTCLTLVGPLLAENQNTVGTHVDVKHLRATPVGQTVWCEATLLTVEGKKLTFKVEAFDEKGLIGTGSHRRFIIDTEAFMASL